MAIWYPDLSENASLGEPAPPQPQRSIGALPSFPEGDGPARVARYEHPEPLCRNRGVIGLERGSSRRLYELEGWRDPGLVSNLTASLRGHLPRAGASIRESLDDGFEKVEYFDVPEGVNPAALAGKLARIIQGETPGLRGHVVTQNAFHSVSWTFAELRRTAGNPPVVSAAHRFQPAPPFLIAYAGQGSLGVTPPAPAPLPPQARGARVVEVAQLQGWDGPYSVSVGYLNRATSKDDWPAEDSLGRDPQIRGDYYWYPGLPADGPKDYLERVRWSDEQLRDDFIRWLVRPPLLAGDVGRQMVERFYGGSRELWVHEPSSSLSAEAYQTDTVTRALERIIAILVPQMNRGVHPTALSIPDNQLPTVNFEMRDSRVLKALIGGTQGIGVRLEDMHVWQGGPPQYRGTILLKIYDVFGVGQSDLYHPSLIDFWLLQHQRRGHRPFINELHIEHRFGYQAR